MPVAAVAMPAPCPPYHHCLQCKISGAKHLLNQCRCWADFDRIGGLPTLLSLLASEHAGLRWRAAEVAAAAAQSNPPVQAWFLDGGMLPRLLHCLDDSDATCRCASKAFTPAQGHIAKSI